MAENPQAHVLIIDDDEQICRLLAEALAATVSQVTTVLDPCLVSQVLRERVYNLVILDVVMPSRSGLDILEEIHTLYPETKVIIMTGHADKTTAIDALRFGAFDLLEKPFSLDFLTHAVKRALHTQQIEWAHQRALEELRQSQKALLERKVELEQVNGELMETNRALSVLVKTVERTRRETEDRIIQRIRSLIIPLLEQLRHDPNLRRYESRLAMLEGYVADLTSAMATNLQLVASLSFSELRIASLIKQGMTNEQIAAQLHVASDTIKTHRRNIRRKLKLSGTRSHLRAYLHSLDLYGASTDGETEFFPREPS